MDNASVLIDAAFDAVTPATVPKTISKASLVSGSCRGLGGILIRTTYQWTLDVKASKFRMVLGTTPQSILDKISGSFSVARSTLEVSDTTAQTSTLATAVLSGLTSQLSAGTYRLEQVVEVQRQSCTWILVVPLCFKDGGKEKFSANYNLTVVDASVPPVTTPPVDPPITVPPGGTEPRPGFGVKPNPWTIPGMVQKNRCDI